MPLRRSRAHRDLVRLRRPHPGRYEGRRDAKRDDGMDLRRKEPDPYVNHYSFSYIGMPNGDIWPSACAVIPRQCDGHYQRP